MRNRLYIPCSRCGKPSNQEWNICADGNQPRGCCTECDILLNQLVLNFMNIPNAEAKLAAYKEKIQCDTSTTD